MQMDNIKVDLRELGCGDKEHNWDAGNKSSMQSSVVTQSVKHRVKFNIEMDLTELT